MSGSVRAMFSAVREGSSVVHLHFFHVGTLALINVLLARLLMRKVVVTAHDVESFVSSLEVPFNESNGLSFGTSRHSSQPYQQ